jgi:hypothetical protein
MFSLRPPNRSSIGSIHYLQSEHQFIDELWCENQEIDLVPFGEQRWKLSLLAGCDCGSDSTLLQVGNADAFHGRCVLLRHASFVRKLNTRRATSTRGIAPNSGIGSEGEVVSGR